MKVLLANIPWVTDKGKYGIRAGSRWAHTRSKKVQTVVYYPFPFFLAYTTAVLKKNGIDAIIKDFIAEEMDEKMFFDYLNSNKFDVLIIETSTASLFNDLRIAKEIKNKYGCIIVLCGPHTSALHNQIMKENDFIDFIMIGEYEYTALDLIKTLEKNGDLKNVFGISYRIKNEIYINPRHELIEDLDALPFPERKELPMHKYNEPFCKHVPNAQMITSRGCPHNCIFCLEPSVYYGKPNFRARSPKNVVDEMEFLLNNYQPKEIYLDDSSFTVDQKRVMEICEEILNRGLDFKWSCMADAKVGFKTLEMMKKAGCIGLKFGVESASPEILKNIRKFISLEDVKRTVRDCKRLNLFTHATFMFGLPGETDETIKKTINFSVKLNTDTAQFAVATPFPGTDFYKMCEERGWLITRDWRKYDGSSCSVIEYPNCQRELIEKAVLDAKKRLFINVLKNPRALRRYIESSYRLNGINGVINNAINKVRFIFGI